MNDLVFLQNEQALTTSLKVAEVFHKKHFNVVRDIEKVIKDCEEMALASQNSKLVDGVNTPMFQKVDYQAEDGGRKYPMYLMNYKGFTLLTMGFTGKKALQFKLAYINAFEEMKQKIIELLAERKSAEWQAARKLSKIEFRNLTDCIKEKLIPQMKKEGASENALRWVYKNYVSMIQKLLGIKKGTRDELPVDLIHELCKVEQMAVIIIKGLIAKGNDCKQIFISTKQKINDYAQFSLFSQRFLA